MRYFQKTFRPDIINGTVGNVIQSNKNALTFGAKDILFDWQSVDVPLGTDAIVDGVVHMYGIDGAAQASLDFYLLIAKSNNGVAPTSLGTVNATITGCYELPDILTGVMKFEGTTDMSGALELDGHAGTIFNWAANSQVGSNNIVAIEPENNNFGGQSTNRIYIAGIVGSGPGFDFSTGVLKDGAETSDTETSLTTKTVDPRKAFRVGDTVYIHDVNTAIGTIASMTATNITLNDAIAGGTDIADEDEFVNAQPITVNLSFRGR